ncbi:MAG: fimbrillin family protein [Bacteroidales bacterium]|nr:fimbrillin family protein [Bacteroidales bacterium]
MLQKRHIVLTVLILSALSACVKHSEYVDYPEPVAFSTYFVRGTKADAGSYVSGSFVPDGSSFAVFSWYHDNSNWATDAPSAPDFMYREEVTRTGSSFTYSPVKYWPNETGDRLSFWAFYPYDSYTTGNTGSLELYRTDKSTAYSNTSTGLPYAVFTVEDDPEDQLDLMFSDVNKDISKPAVGAKVNIQFHHALTQVVFKAISKGPSGMDIVINSLSLKDVVMKGGVQTTDTATSAVWEPDASVVSDIDLDLVSGSIPVEADGESAAVITAAGQELLLIPQTLKDADHNVLLEVTYTITPPSGVTGHAVEYSFEVELSSTDLAAWAMGKIVTYTLNINSDSLIWFSVNTSPWDATGGMNESIIVE